MRARSPINCPPCWLPNPMTLRLSSLTRRLCRPFLAAALLLLAGTPAFAEECRMISLEQLNAALPHYAPWTLYSGGTGGCRFEGEYEGTRLNYAALSFTQQFHPSRQVATSILDSIRKESAKSFKLQPVTIPGADPGSFFAAHEENGEPRNSMMWYVQAGRAIILGSFTPAVDAPSALSEETALMDLLKRVVADTRNPVTAQQAAQCPYFDEALIRKLIPGKKVSMERFGENSCMAKNEKNAVVVLSRSANIDARVAENLLRSAATGCTFEPQPSLGEYGGISHHCSSGNLRADVVFYKDDSHFSLSLSTNGEPTGKQREYLIELARFVYNQ